jgi:hypothetical protein
LYAPDPFTLDDAGIGSPRCPLCGGNIDLGKIIYGKPKSEDSDDAISVYIGRSAMASDSEK